MLHSYGKRKKPLQSVHSLSDVGCKRVGFLYRLCASVHDMMRGAILWFRTLGGTPIGHSWVAASSYHHKISVLAAHSYHHKLAVLA